MLDLFRAPSKELILRDYQEAAIESARENIRKGHRNQILCAPTGAGKTIIALGLMKLAMQAGSRSAFITDRTALIDQTSQAMDLYGIDHGVMQATHWRSNPRAYVQLVSAQTLGRRLGNGGYVDYHLKDLRFVLIDECFVGETMVATPNGNTRISDIRSGDAVLTAMGVSTVQSVFNGFTNTLCTVRLSNGKAINCTTDHPFFTEHGWQEAGALGRGARLFGEQALRALWRAGASVPMGQVALLGDGIELRQAEFLREVLRQEGEEPHALGSHAVEGGGHPSADRPSADEARRQWTGIDRGAIGALAVIEQGLGARAFGYDRPGARGGRRLPLQDRPRASDLDDRCGDRRGESRHAGCAGAGQAEGRGPSSVWVEGVEIIERRSLVPVYNLRIGGHPSYFAGGVLVHNCHTLYKSTRDWLDMLPSTTSVIGLTATPFTKGLGKHFQAIVNVATTDGLIGSGNLVRPVVYAAVEADISGVTIKSTGEWDDAGLEKAGVTIVGDVAGEYVKRSIEHFGKPEKAICFSSTVAHGEEICRAMAQQGLNFQNISYLDDEDERRAKIEEFRKPDSGIKGLVSCDALAKGFDVPDVKVCILCRPLRKSLTTHIQQIGRVMRPAPGKEIALVIDHTGNAMRFLDDTVDFWDRGVDELDEGAEKDRKPRELTEKERKERACPRCKAVFSINVSTCPACGWERPPKPSGVTVVNGSTQMLDMSKSGMGSSRKFDFANHPLLKDPLMAYRCFVAWATERKRGDVAAGQRWAAGLYKGVYEQWPPRSWQNLPVVPDLATFDVESFCRREMARFAKSRAAA